jgi:putative transposase
MRRKHPGYIHGWAVLPDHFYCFISLPEGDTNHALRWRLIKGRFSKVVPKTEAIDAAR